MWLAIIMWCNVPHRGLHAKSVRRRSSEEDPSSLAPDVAYSLAESSFYGWLSTTPNSSGMTKRSGMGPGRAAK